MPFISVITSTLNCIEDVIFLEKSLQAQSFADFEWLIADGGSKDGTLEYLTQSETANIVASESDSGVYEAWNKALPYARGEWIIFLGADDRLYDQNVFRNFFSFNNELINTPQIIYGRVAVEERLFGRHLVSLKSEMSLGMAMCHQALFHHRSLFDDFGGFEKNYSIAGDYEFLLRSISGGASAIYTPLIVSYMGQAGISSQLKNGLVSALEVISARRKNGFAAINTPWVKHFLKGVVAFVCWKILPNSLYSKLDQLRLRVKND